MARSISFSSFPRNFFSEVPFLVLRDELSFDEMLGRIKSKITPQDVVVDRRPDRYPCRITKYSTFQDYSTLAWELSFEYFYYTEEGKEKKQDNFKYGRDVIGES